jgi:hypothetical protein
MLAVENTLYVNRRTNIAGGTKCKRREQREKPQMNKHFSQYKG